MPKRYFISYFGLNTDENRRKQQKYLDSSFYILYFICYYMSHEIILIYGNWVEQHTETWYLVISVE